MNATRPSASRRWSRAASRAWIAVTASPVATSMPRKEPPVIAAIRRWRRSWSRWTRSSRPTPNIPAITFSSPRRLPSPASRRSAASGSARRPVGRPRRSYCCVSAAGKQSSSSRPGAPATIAAMTQPSGCTRLKYSISSFVQRDLAAAGEQRTMRQREAVSATRISSVRSSLAASSWRSRKMGDSRFGMTPLAVSRPASVDGIRNLSSSRCSQSASFESAWL